MADGGGEGGASAADPSRPSADAGISAVAKEAERVVKKQRVATARQAEHVEELLEACRRARSALEEHGGADAPEHAAEAVRQELEQRLRDAAKGPAATAASAAHKELTACVGKLGKARPDNAAPPASPPRGAPPSRQAPPVGAKGAPSDPSALLLLAFQAQAAGRRRGIRGLASLMRARRLVPPPSRHRPRAQAVEKAFIPDVTLACREDALDEEPLALAVAQELYRSGRTEIADQYCATRPGLREGCAGLREAFIAMHRVVDALKRGELEPAYAWIEENRAALEAKSGGEPPELEFLLHRLSFIRLLEAGDRNGAVAFARQSFAPFSQSHTSEIMRLMGSLVYVGSSTASSPYADLTSESRYDAVAHEFTRACCRLMGQPSNSPLAVVINAGAIALPRLLKLVAVMGSKSQDWNGMTQLPVEIELPDELTFHSIFACPVARDQCTPENPPMVLPCGLVLSKHSITKLAKGNSRSFKCPYCPQEVSVSHCRPIHL